MCFEWSQWCSPATAGRLLPLAPVLAGFLARGDFASKALKRFLLEDNHGLAWSVFHLGSDW